MYDIKAYTYQGRSLFAVTKDGAVIKRDFTTRESAKAYIEKLVPKTILGEDTIYGLPKKALLFATGFLAILYYFQMQQEGE